MTYEEGMNLVEAFQASVELADDIDANDIGDTWADIESKAKNIRDYLGEFIGSLISESPIGDRRHE